MDIVAEIHNKFAGQPRKALDEPSGESQKQRKIAEDQKLTDYDAIRKRLDEVKENYLDWGKTTGSARKWWNAFEEENKSRLNLVLRLAREMEDRKATIAEFFLAYVYSNTDNIQANLAYLDYTRLKKEEERKRKEAAIRASQNSADGSRSKSSSEPTP